MTDADDLIPWHSGRFLLGHAAMDHTHADFAVLVNRLALAEDAESPRCSGICSTIRSTTSPPRRR